MHISLRKHLGKCLSCPGDTEQHSSSSHLSDKFDAFCDTHGGSFCPSDCACHGSESVNAQDQVLVGDSTCQVKLSAVKSWPTQTTAKCDSTQELPQMDGHISTQAQLDAETGSSNMTDTHTLLGQTCQPCPLLRASLSDSLLPAQQWDYETAALPPEQCMASLTHVGKALLQCQCSWFQESTDSAALLQLNADFASVPVAMSMVDRMVSAATGYFCI